MFTHLAAVRERPVIMPTSHESVCARVHEQRTASSVVYLEDRARGEENNNKKNKQRKREGEGEVVGVDEWRRGGPEVLARKI